MGPLNALIFHLHLPSELSLTSQDAYLTPPPLSQTLQTPSHSDSVNDSASFLWEKIKHSEKIISFSYNQTLQSISVQFSSVAQLCPTLCDTMDCSTPGFPVHQLPELAQTQVHRVGDAIQPFHPLWSPSLPAFNLSQHQGFFK